MITSTAPVAGQPRHAQAARLVARVLAREHRSAVADLASNQIVEQGHHPGNERREFLLSDSWFALFLTLQDHDAHRAEDAEAGTLMAAHTAGLAWFGLPELTTTEIPADLYFSAGDLFRGLAHRLLFEYWSWLRSHPTSPTATLPGDYQIGSGDVQRYHQMAWPAAGHTGAPDPQHHGVHLTLTAERSDRTQGQSALIVAPSATHTGNRADWWREVVAPALPGA